MNVVDSCAWLAYFAGENNAEAFSVPIEATDDLIVPAVCLYEVFKVLLRESGEDKAFEAVASMQQGEVVDLDAELALEAAAIALMESLSFADATIYTVALKMGAKLWTQDQHFSGRPLVRYFPKAV
jgi:predicted nucleic acid-binding protein